MDEFALELPDLPPLSGVEFVPQPLEQREDESERGAVWQRKRKISETLAVWTHSASVDKPLKCLLEHIHTAQRPSLYVIGTKEPAPAHRLQLLLDEDSSEGARKERLARWGGDPRSAWVGADWFVVKAPFKCTRQTTVIYNSVTKEALVAMAKVENPLRLVRPEASPSFESWRGVPWIEFPAVLRACREAGDSCAATFWERFDAVPRPEAPDHFLDRDEFCAHLVAQTLEECGVDSVFGRLELTLEDVARGDALKASLVDVTTSSVKHSVKGSLAFIAQFIKPDVLATDVMEWLGASDQDEVHCFSGTLEEKVAVRRVRPKSVDELFATGAFSFGEDLDDDSWNLKDPDVDVTAVVLYHERLGKAFIFVSADSED
jgi:hypothetical protein